MRDEYKKWFDKARSDLNIAKYNLKGGFFDAAIFYSQQSAEKALKALQIKNHRIMHKTHDLIVLGRHVNLSPKLIEKVKELTLAYAYSRYPDVEAVENLEEQANELIKTSEEVFKWVEKKL